MKTHRIFIATDGSPPASAALATAVAFPWHPGSRVRALTAVSEWMFRDSTASWLLLKEAAQKTADVARAALSRRWGDAEVVVVEKTPVDAILSEAERFEASVIVLGWRGHGAFQRLLAGSVSRAVAARALSPVLVVRDSPVQVRRFLVGYDGTPNSTRAIEFLCSLAPGEACEVMLVNVVEPVSLPASASMLPEATRARLQHEVTKLNGESTRDAEHVVERAVAQLRSAGWRATAQVRHGAPLATLLDEVDKYHADILVLGARAVSGVERALLGSVANGAMNRSAVPVVLAR